MLAGLVSLPREDDCLRLSLRKKTETPPSMVRQEPYFGAFRLWADVFFRVGTVEAFAIGGDLRRPYPRKGAGHGRPTRVGPQDQAGPRG